ncbi:Putative amino acid/polyamine transporter I [Septoria linicola]|uniref:Amino acid/polyamine transporter I n=1 Tax=Septoria linicola TaxID=215465 RepID=A0A9Q9AXZ5_9PEZI|nr:putative amino acid/polyamine transporter I [Septoria linicola]USW57144.1 Putative amino acid/polyamine transporter I [Septoria linicola]
MALITGGLPGLVWSVVWAHVGQLMIVLSLAEMSSLVPVAGGPYQWVSAFAPQPYQQLLSYLTGSLCSIGWQARFTVICYLLAGIMLALVETNHDDFHSTKWQRNLLTIAVASVVSAFNALAAAHLSIAEGVFALCHVYALVPIVVSLWLLASKGSVADVFLNFTDNGGNWPSSALGVLVGQLPAMFTVLGSEATAHIAEEVEEPNKILPRCMVWSYLANLPGTLILLLTFAFNISDLNSAMNDMIPFGSVLRTALNSREANTGFLTVILSLMFMVAVSTMVSTSRHLFSFARDRALYSSPWFSKVDTTLQVPLNAIYSTLILTIVLVLVTIWNRSPLNTMMGLTVAALMSAYIVAIGSFLKKRLSGEGLPQAGWSLGNAGIWINGFAILYATWSLFWSFWPVKYRPSARDMNWAILLYLTVVSYGLGFFISSQRRLRLRPMEMIPTWARR